MCKKYAELGKSKSGLSCFFQDWAVLSKKSKVWYEVHFIIINWYKTKAPWSWGLVVAN